MKRLLVRGGVVVLLIAGFVGYRLVWGRPFTINQLADRQALFFLLSQPELTSSLGLIDGTVLDRHSDRLTPVGMEQRRRDEAFAAKSLEELAQFDRDALSAQDQLTYDVLKRAYDDQRAWLPFPWMSSEGIYPIGPMFGGQVSLLSFLQDTHVVKNERTARSYVSRLKAADDKLDALTAETLRLADAGVVLPLPLLERSIEGIDAFLAQSPEASGLVTTFATRMKDEPSIDAETSATLLKEAEVAVRDEVRPAFARMKTGLESIRSVAATTPAGVGRLPDGQAVYRVFLEQSTTTKSDPDQLHQLGVQEVERLSGALDELLVRQGLDGGSVGERLEQLRLRDDQHAPNTDEGRAQIIERYKSTLSELATKARPAFRSVPDEPLEVERMAPELEGGSTHAQYDQAALDGSRRAVFRVNLRDTRELATFTMKTTAAHEGIPGHHFQTVVADRLEGLPLARTQVPVIAYSEGWALYAERLMAELGSYENDPLGDIGRLQAELLRAVRLVIDTGLHAKGWTREQAITFLISHTGFAEAQAVSEIERAMELPGYGCAYKVGQLELLSMRERARVALGSAFELTEFHAVVLENGPLPLTVLNRVVDEWIAGKGRPAK